MKVANILYILSWALAATTISASPLASDPSLSRRGNAISGAKTSLQTAKTSYQNAGLAAAAKGHECNNAMKHVVSGASACCPAYHSCISSRKDAETYGRGLCEPERAATPAGKACCPPRASCIKKSKTPMAMNACDSSFVKCLGQNGA
ncbi:hypothetical protein BC829DRAFT_448107 [Chytridium lagenaria]|nr:hypothetical protein BC829DRAFT_448107 [Chytridium lagenaria]